MTRASATLDSAIFFVAAPGMVRPCPLWISGIPHPGQPWLQASLFRAAGGLLLAMGILAYWDSFADLLWKDAGHPRAVLQPDLWCRRGLYRYVRNPMYVAVLLAVFGQGLPPLAVSPCRLRSPGLAMRSSFVRSMKSQR